MSNEKAREAAKKRYGFNDRAIENVSIPVKSAINFAQEFSDQENASLKEALAVARKYMKCPIEMDGLEFMKETEIVRELLTNNQQSDEHP